MNLSVALWTSMTCLQQPCKQQLHGHHAKQKRPTREATAESRRITSSMVQTSWKYSFGWCSFHNESFTRPKDMASKCSFLCQINTQNIIHFCFMLNHYIQISWKKHNIQKFVKQLITSWFSSFKAYHSVIRKSDGILLPKCFQQIRTVLYMIYIHFFLIRQIVCLILKTFVNVFIVINADVLAGHVLFSMVIIPDYIK